MSVAVACLLEWQGCQFLHDSGLSLHLGAFKGKDSIFLVQANERLPILVERAVVVLVEGLKHDKVVILSGRTHSGISSLLKTSEALGFSGVQET